MEHTGERYEGDSRNGRMEGKGKYYFSDGSYYEGQFIDGMEIDYEKGNGRHATVL